MFQHEAFSEKRLFCLFTSPISTAPAPHVAFLSQSPPGQLESTTRAREAHDIAIASFFAPHCLRPNALLHRHRFLGRQRGLHPNRYHILQATAIECLWRYGSERTSSYALKTPLSVSTSGSGGLARRKRGARGRQRNAKSSEAECCAAVAGHCSDLQPHPSVKAQSWRRGKRELGKQLFWRK